MSVILRTFAIRYRDDYHLFSESVEFEFALPANKPVKTSSGPPGKRPVNKPSRTF